MKVDELLDIAIENDVSLNWVTLILNKSISAEIGENKYIIIDENLENDSEIALCLSHELGHCLYGGFYNFYAPPVYRGKHEHDADTWILKRFLPFDDFDKALREETQEPWQLAELFNVHEKLIHIAFKHYYNVEL